MRIKQRELVGKVPVKSFIKDKKLYQVYRKPMCVNVITGVEKQCYEITLKQYLEYTKRGKVWNILLRFFFLH